MAFTFPPSWCISFSFLLLSLFAEVALARKMSESTSLDIHLSEDPVMKDPNAYVFFKENNFKLGTKLPLYFSKKDLSVLPLFLPREQADSIPFSASNLPFLLRFFSIPGDSPQATGMAWTLDKCSMDAVEGEIKFCATSLESMLDFVRESLEVVSGHSQLRIMTTKSLSGNLSKSVQNYTLSESPKELFGAQMLGCHSMPYPYAVYYCHGHTKGSRLFEVSLVGEKDGERIVGPAVCHLDTSSWDPDHLAFHVLRMKPGSGPVCHFFPLDNFVWVKM